MDEQKPKDDELGENLGDIFKEDFFEKEPVEVPHVKNLHKVKKDSLIAGVCTGIAKYFGIEPVIVRVIFVISIFLGGWGIAAYIIAALLIPSEKNITPSRDNAAPGNNYAKTITGSLFVFTGLFFIADNFGFTGSLLFYGMPGFLIVPALLIFSGVFILIKINDFQPFKSGTRKAKFFRSKNDRRLLGVCGGLADYLNVESNNLRMFWIIFSFITMGTGLILYIFIAALTQTGNDIQFEI